MLREFLTKTFYGNSLSTWLLSAGIVLVSLVTARFLYWFFAVVVKKLSQRTKTRMDDILVDKMEEPIIFAFVLAGLWYALELLTKGSGTQAFVNKVFLILIIFDITWFLVRLFDAVVEEYLVPLVQKTESTLDDQLLPIFRKSARYAIWFIGAILALNNAGYDVGALIAGFGIGGLAFALAAQDLIKNLFGGVTIFMDKPFMVGQRIVVSGFDGTVEEIGIRSLRIRTLDGRLVIIPNSDVSNKPVENISSEPSRKISLLLNLTYGMRPEQMQQAVDILREIINSHELLEDDTLPEDAEPGQRPPKRMMLGFVNFGSYSLDIRLIYFIKPDNNFLQVQHEINLAILTRFNQAGLEFAYPTQTILTQPTVE